MISILSRKNRVRLALASLLLTVGGCGGGDKVVPTVDVPKGGKDNTSRDISNPLQSAPPATTKSAGK